MSAATILSEAYGEDADLYTTVLNVPKDATPSQLRKAYYKKCLKYHPDKLSSNLTNDEKELAKKKFQAISLAYTILSDEEKRKEYDESGDLYEDDDDLATNKSGMKQWTDYFNSIFPKVTTADIDAFEVKYKCSDEEQSDVLKYYTQFKGDLNKMLECVMLSSDVDKGRWVQDYIEPAIERGDVDDFSAKITKTLGSAPAKKRKTKGNNANKSKQNQKQKKKIEEEEVEMEEDGSDDGSDSDIPMAEIVDEDEEDNAMEENFENKKASSSSAGQASKKKASSTSSSGNKTSPKKKSSTTKASKPSKKKKKSSSEEDDLIAQIRGNALARTSREAGFDSMMAGLEERYGGGGKKKTKKGKGKKEADDDDIDDDEFAKIQAKIMKNKESRKKR